MQERSLLVSVSKINSGFQSCLGAKIFQLNS